jgi:pyruvate dehydrogenase E1 component alpha subunit
MGTAVDRASAVSDIAQKAEGYGMKNRQANGMDIMEVRKVAEEMIAEIRSGTGPQLLEIITYRFRGHSMGDPERYRKQEEVHKYQENDPIGIFRKYLIDNEITSEAELDEQDDLAIATIQKAVEFAENSPEPAPEELFKHIYVEA